MNTALKILIISCMTTILGAAPSAEKKPLIQIVLGSTRQGRMSDKIGKALKQLADKRSDITAEIVDLNDFNLPFLREEISPAARKKITDPQVAAWSNKINKADAFIFIVPEYNASFPGVLKNALDSLYAEWHDKPVGFVAYSGGPSGGAAVISQLRLIAQALKMKPISSEIAIGLSRNALTPQGALANKKNNQTFNTMIDQLRKCIK